MLGWIHADVAGHTLEGRLAAAGAVASNAIEALQTTRGSAAPRDAPPGTCPPSTHLALVIAGMLEATDAGFTVGPVEAFAALGHLPHVHTHKRARKRRRHDRD